MKRSKKIYALLAVLLVACIATVGVMKYEEKKEQIKNSDEIILSISSDSVTSLSWENDGEKLSFHKAETWLYDEDKQFPVDEEAIQRLLELFEEFGASFIIEDVEDYAQYGLDDPVCTIRITAANQANEAETANNSDISEGSADDNQSGVEEYTFEIKLGSFSSMDSQRYVSIGDGNVYLVANDPLDLYDSVLDDMMKHDETPNFEVVSNVAFSGAYSYEFTYEEESTNTYCAEDVYFAQMDGKSLPLDTTHTNDYLNSISSLNPTNYVNYKVSEEELSTYGLDHPELSVTVNYSYEDEDEQEISDTFIIHVSRNPEAVQEAEKETEENNSEAEDIPAYIRIDDSPIIYEITAAQYGQLMAGTYDDLRHKEVITANFDDIYKVDITLEGENYTLTSTKSEENEEEVIWKYADEELEITDFKNALQMLEADSFVSEEPTGKEELSLTVYLDNENFPQVSIALYRYDGSSCLATVDGETISLVNRSLAVDLIETVNAIVLN